MHLSRIKIENLRSLQRVELVFPPPGKTSSWTILLGENGTGKSTILRAIALVTAGSDALMELVGEPSSWIRSEQSAARIEATLVTARGETREVKLVLNRGESKVGLVRENTQGLAPLDDALRHASQNYFVVGYGASRRLAEPELSRGDTERNYRAAAVQTLFDRGAPLNSLEAWALELDYADREGGLSIIEDTLNELLDGVRVAGLDRSTRKLTFETDYGVVPLEQLSDGFQNMAAWLGDLLFRVTRAFGHHANPLETRGLLLLDELGLHLHPILQRRLMERIRSCLPNMQVIATSHSPLIAGAMRREELYVAERHEAQVQIERPADSPYGLSPDQILASPIFGLGKLRAASFEADLRQTQGEASAGDLDAAERLSKMLAFGEAWSNPPGPQ